ncbi:putative cytoplasmic protein [Alkalibacterium sp. AK22]|uniref:DUF1456 family protein n=1 Tax=Alkalibacterium sp. AK22 TaxID=1229520 RepID=UPI000448C4F3|nr:DUF1456 family protein [Alkalibacterium sp. AK22]EXJ22497.1 putative cytoplasmic protein [Alkalibacterium sp. AK22]
MNNNDRLVRLRYALDVKDEQLVEIFKLGQQDISKAEVQELLKKAKTEENSQLDREPSDRDDYSAETLYEKSCSNRLLESFLNGFIIYERGQQYNAHGEPIQPTYLLEKDQDANNVLIKKVKIALALTSDDILDILDETGVRLSNSELSAVLRKQGHRNYKVCGDRYARNFLKGLAYRFRD